ncbi:xanthine dehydrogenase family protein molybdopterin-binding subunit [Microvirga brassicacearum]|uniref:Xanthine dehydrogenase family protein molybdopterin-binding subunit n=1 Tax=Microvirga brassicacearum TaxID=2580413 RepID=A0A5N3PEB0_9HYPH|nr:xanthine dehydrogenase family protein molybdopterin-binding subunit [Microvirga brassicacearum]KAB0268040.1 xanthine dehydrogenase family protein molybdopterin-binding subunit [Microvirga brassicacearum]
MLKQIGIAQNRVDGPMKVTGEAAYAADRRPGGQLYALAVRSPVAAGTITRIETAAAKSVAGIVAIYTHANAPAALDWHADPAVMALSGEGLGRQALEAAEPEAPPPYLPMTGPDIVFAGQWIAVVVATSLEAAREASLLVKPIIEPHEASVEIDARNDRFLEPGFFFAADMQVQRGAWPDTAAKQQIVSETYRTPMQNHHPMEPSATVAVWDGDAVTVFDSTQGVMATREYVARSLKLPLDKVRVISAFVGGGFGGKNQTWPHQALAAHIARALGRPVRLQLTRADMAVASGHRSQTEQDVALQAASDGSLTALRHVSRVPTSLHGNFFEPSGLNSLMLYEAAALGVRHHVVRKAFATPTPFRAPGETPGSFAVESAVDELAHALAQNPLDLRQRYIPSRDHYHDRDWSSNNLLECYRRGAEAFGWPEGVIVPRARRDGHELIGVGMATTAYPAPALPAIVRLRLRVEGKLQVETSATDIGTGMYTILAQTVADELSLPVEAIEVRLGDSNFPHAPTAGRSKSTASLLPAAQHAARALLQRLAAAVREPLSELSNVALQDRLKAAGLAELEAEGSSTGLQVGQQVSFYSFGAHFIEVRVDEALGRVSVTRVVSALDCGRIVNPKTATSQIRGGIIFGIGMALMEDAAFHPTRARMINDNLADYAIPVNADIPEIDVIFVGEPDNRFNELGVRGLGEIGVPGTAAAIANAVFAATGQRVRNLPITPSAIVRGGE